jgi:hypothetical protein
VIVRVDVRGAEPQVSLAEPDDFKAFKLVLTDDRPSLATQLAGTGIAGVEEHAWIEIDAVRRLAGDAATPEWEDSFSKMLDYARSKGWVDDERATVRAHVEHS